MLKFHCCMQWRLVCWICSTISNSSLYSLNWSDSMSRTERPLFAKRFPTTRCRFSRFHLSSSLNSITIHFPTCCDDVFNDQSEIHTLAQIRIDGFNTYWPSLRPKALIQSVPVPTFLFPKKKERKCSKFFFLCLQLSRSNVLFIPSNGFYAKAGY